MIFIYFTFSYTSHRKLCIFITTSSGLFRFIILYQRPNFAHVTFWRYKFELFSTECSVCRLHLSPFNMKSIILFAILAVCLESTLGYRFNRFEESSSEDRIYGSELAKPGQFPFFVGVKNPGHTGGGSIISNRWVVTSTKGLSFFKEESTYVLAGFKHHGDARRYNLEKIVINPERIKARTLSNDIALLRTTEVIEFNKLVQPIQLAKRLLKGGESVTLTGFPSLVSK